MYNPSEDWLVELHDQAQKSYQDALSQMDYATFLRSAYWRDMKRRVRQRAGGTCEACGDNGWQVHHKVYRGRGHEHLEDLELLCAECHLRRQEYLPRGTNFRLKRLAEARDVPHTDVTTLWEAREREKYLRNLLPPSLRPDSDVFKRRKAAAFWQLLLEKGLWLPDHWREAIQASAVSSNNAVQE